MKNKPFDYTLDYKNLDLRENSHLYRVGKGEQGVLLVEPYKSEILPFWRFRTPKVAQLSADKIYELFLDYLKSKDFVGADMARKFLQMGYTRSRRYANHKSGKKYSKEDKQRKFPTKEIPSYFSQKNRNHFVKTKTKKVLPLEPDSGKAKSAEIFYEKYQLAKNNSLYQKLKNEHQEKYG